MNARPAVRFGAEAAGTAILVAVGTATIVAAARSGGIPQAEMAIAWFFAVLVPIVLFVEVSGAHLNPAVTLGLAASGRIAWKEVPPYILAQMVGAFVGSGAVALLLGRNADLGATVPSTSSAAELFALEAGFTALLLLSVFILADRGEGAFRWRLVLPPSVVGLSTLLIGPITGSSLNPARTLAPAVLSGSYPDIAIYLVAVPIGALVAAAVLRPRAVDRLDRGPGRTSVSH